MTSASAVAKLRGAFKLVAIDLEHPSPKRVASAQREVGKFLLSEPTGVPGASTGGIWFGSNLTVEPSVEDLRDLQDAVHRIVDGLLSGRPVADPPEIALRLAPLVVEGGGVVVKVIEATIVDRFVGALLLLLANAGAGRVQPCPYCGGAFLKLGRRKHCGRVECEKRHQQAYWEGYKGTPNALASRKKFYDTHGWTLGARKAAGKKTKQGGLR